MIRIALVATYVISMVGAVISMDSGGLGWLQTIWVIASVLLGAGTGEYRFAFLALLAVPIAIPFGLPADRNSDPVFPVWFAATYFAVFSCTLIMVGALARRLVESHLRRRRTPRDSRIA